MATNPEVTLYEVWDGKTLALVTMDKTVAYRYATAADLKVKEVQYGRKIKGAVANATIRDEIQNIAQENIPDRPIDGLRTVSIPNVAGQ